MERISSIDPFAAGKPPSVSTPHKSRPLPEPPKDSAKKSKALPSRGREREMHQLIHDLAVLMATNKPSDQ
jgi:hypothetical protein